MAMVLEPRSAGAPESSDRSFGFVFAAVFGIIGILPLLHRGSPRWWAFGVAAGFGLLAAIRPTFLHLPNRAWLALGRLLHRIVSPLIMGAVFFLCVTPLAWVARLRQKDLLSLAIRRDLSTYWIDRDPPPKPAAMKRQF